MAVCQHVSRGKPVSMFGKIGFERVVTHWYERRCHVEVKRGYGYCLEAWGEESELSEQRSYFAYLAYFVVEDRLISSLDATVAISSMICYDRLVSSRRASDETVN